MTATSRATALINKYRPGTFSGLIGQDALVRTLRNTFASGKIKQAYMLTGIRGVGKTTSARAIAKALNCATGMTAEPCGTCEQCLAISEDRHLDVTEMNAGSATGVDNIRSLIEQIAYRPVFGRFKVYIIDEAHQLSNAAWNALLKIIEEPPEHVMFVFASTELAKIPLTIRSRCQTIQLRPVAKQVLAAFYVDIAKLEEATIEASAADLIAESACGSVRDGLSILDQGLSNMPGHITEAGLRQMLALADRSQVYDLIEASLNGDGRDLVQRLRRLWDDGADPHALLKDILEILSKTTEAAVAPDLFTDSTVAEIDRIRTATLAGRGVQAIREAFDHFVKWVPTLQTSPVPQSTLLQAMLNWTKA